MRVFAVISKEALPKRRMSQCCIISVCQTAINIINCAQEGASFITEQGIVKEKIHISFNIKATWTTWIQIILKTWLNLCSRKWLKPKRSLLRYLIPLQLWQLKALFADGLIKFIKLVLKTLRLAALNDVGRKRIFEKSYV